MSCGRSRNRSKSPKRIIIPKGSIQPNETVVIEIPARLRNNNTVLARRKSQCPTCTVPPQGNLSQPIDRSPPKSMPPPKPMRQQQKRYNKFNCLSRTLSSSSSDRMPNSNMEVEAATAGNTYGVQPVKDYANMYESQAPPRANATCICDVASGNSASWTKSKEKYNVAFAPPYSSRYVEPSNAPCRGNTFTQTPPTVPFYGNSNENSDVCPENYNTFNYSNNAPVVSSYMSAASSSSIETYREETTEEYECSGNIDDSLLGKILRGEIGRKLETPTSIDPRRANATTNLNSPSKKGNETSSRGDETKGCSPCSPCSKGNATYDTRNTPFDAGFGTYNNSNLMRDQGSTTYSVEPYNDNQSLFSPPLASTQVPQWQQQSFTTPCPPNESSGAFESPSTTSGETYTEEIIEEIYDSSEGDIDDSLMGKILRGDIGRRLVWPTPPGEAAAGGNATGYSPYGSPKSPNRLQGSSYNQPSFSPQSAGTSMRPASPCNSRYGAFNKSSFSPQLSMSTREPTLNSTCNASPCNSSYRVSKQPVVSQGATFNKQFPSTAIRPQPNTGCNAPACNCLQCGAPRLPSQTPNFDQTSFSPQFASTATVPEINDNTQVSAEELEQMEAIEKSQLENNLKRWQEARRKLVFDTAKLSTTNLSEDNCPC